MTTETKWTIRDIRSFTDPNYLNLMMSYWVNDYEVTFIQEAGMSLGLICNLSRIADVPQEDGFGFIYWQILYKALASKTDPDKQHLYTYPDLCKHHQCGYHVIMGKREMIGNQVHLSVPAAAVVPIHASVWVKDVPWEPPDLDTLAHIEKKLLGDDTT